jgi:NAD(P)H-dependent FMN reductase
MKTLILTHSTPTGINYKVCEDISSIVNGSIHNIQIVMVTEASEPHFENVDKIIMVIPEWNGSIPWTFKKLIDDSGWPSFFLGKQVLLIGTANTSFGNVTGVSHMNQILEWIGSKTFHKKVYIPEIKNYITEDIENPTHTRLRNVVLEFIEA